MINSFHFSRTDPNFFAVNQSVCLNSIWQILSWTLYYWWWKNCCITWDKWNLVNNEINVLSAGEGFQPSTVWCTEKELNDSMMINDVCFCKKYSISFLYTSDVHEMHWWVVWRISPTSILKTTHPMGNVNIRSILNAWCCSLDLSLHKMGGVYSTSHKKRGKHSENDVVWTNCFFSAWFYPG